MELASSFLCASVEGYPLTPNYICKAIFIPKSRRFKQYLQKGVINVVRRLLSSCSVICQKPESMSRDVKTVEPDSLASDSFVVGS